MNWSMSNSFPSLADPASDWPEHLLRIGIRTVHIRIRPNPPIFGDNENSELKNEFDENEISSENIDAFSEMAAHQLMTTPFWENQIDEMPDWRRYKASLLNKIKLKKAHIAHLLGMKSAHPEEAPDPQQLPAALTGLYPDDQKFRNLGCIGIRRPKKIGNAQCVWKFRKLVHRYSVHEFGLSIYQTEESDCGLFGSHSPNQNSRRKPEFLCHGLARVAPRMQLSQRLFGHHSEAHFGQ